MEFSNKQQSGEIAKLIVKRLFNFNETFDRSDVDDLNKFLENNAFDLKSFTNEVFKQIKETKTCDFSKFFTVGSSLQLPYIANSFMMEAEEFDKLTQFLDSSVS